MPRFIFPISPIWIFEDFSAHLWAFFLRYFSKDFRLCYALGKIPPADTAASFSTSFAVDSALMLLHGFNQISRVIFCLCGYVFGNRYAALCHAASFHGQTALCSFASHPERYFQPVCWSLHGRILLIIWFHPRPLHCLKIPLVCSWSVIGRFLGAIKTTIRLMVFLWSDSGYMVVNEKTTQRLK